MAHDGRNSLRTGDLLLFLALVCAARLALDLTPNVAQQLCAPLRFDLAAFVQHAAPHRAPQQTPIVDRRALWNVNLYGSRGRRYSSSRLFG
jgi:hypothetical protein